MDIYFLSAKVRLTKAISIEDGQIVKKSYQEVKYLTSHKESCATLTEFFNHIKKHADAGHCLVKGKLHRELKHESRAGATEPEEATDWVCIDLDGIDYPTPEAFMNAHEQLRDLSYIVQYSSSFKIEGLPPKLSCHIFFLLDKPIRAPLIKPWLMDLNLKNNRENIHLNRLLTTLHWPIDITVWQNDKLLYIAPPILEKNVVCTAKPGERIYMVRGKVERMPIARIAKARSLVECTDEAKALRDLMRKGKGLKPYRSTSSQYIGDKEVLRKPGEATITGSYEARGFVYFNFNGGDSFGYFHPVDNFEIIYNFKEEPLYYTKELLPQYYAKMVADGKDLSTPNNEGQIILAFNVLHTANYLRGSWNPTEHILELYPARNEKQLADWRRLHGLMPQEVIPVWETYFDPTKLDVYNEKEKRINVFVPSEYLRQKHPPTSLDKCPTIRRIIKHAVSGGKEDETFEWFINWLAVICQKRVKTRTAWVFRGTQGTGKGLIIYDIIRPLLGGMKYVPSKKASDLDQQFTEWLETALVAGIEEAHISASAKRDSITADMKYWITEKTIGIRPMYISSREMENFTNFIVTSNDRGAVVIDKQDRRYNVGIYQHKKLVLSDEEKNKKIPAELPHFMSYLMNYKINVLQAGSILENEAHKELIDDNTNTVEEVTQNILAGALETLWEEMPPNDPNYINQTYGARAIHYHRFMDLMAREVLTAEAGLTLIVASTDKWAEIPSRLSRDELRWIYEACVGEMPLGNSKFTRMLKYKGLDTKQLRFPDGKRMVGAEVTWRVEKKWLKETAAEIRKAGPKLHRVK